MLQNRKNIIKNCLHIGAGSFYNLFTGQSALQPYTAHIQGGVKAGLFTLLHNTIPTLCSGICQLKLNRYAGCDIYIVDLLGFQDLQHHNVAVSHGTVVNKILFAHQGMPFIHQTFGHNDLLKKWKSGGLCGGKSLPSELGVFKQIATNQFLQKLITVNLTNIAAGIIVIGDIGGIFCKQVTYDLVDGVVALFVQSIKDATEDSMHIFLFIAGYSKLDSTL